MPLIEIREGRKYIYPDNQWLSNYRWRNILYVDPRAAIAKIGARTRRERIPNNHEGYGIRVVTPVEDLPKIMEALSKTGRYTWLNGINFAEDFEFHTPSTISGGLKYEYPQKIVYGLDNPVEVGHH